MRITKQALSALALFTCLGSTSHAAETKTSLNLRAGPGTTHNVLTSIPAGANVSIDSCSGRWCAVSYDGRSGYASRAYLTGPSGDYQERRRSLVPDIPRKSVRGSARELDTYDYLPSYRRGRADYSYRPYGYHGYRGFRASGRLGPPRLGDSVGLGRRSLR